MRSTRLAVPLGRFKNVALEVRVAVAGWNYVYDSTPPSLRLRRVNMDAVSQVLAYDDNVVSSHAPNAWLVQRREQLTVGRPFAYPMARTDVSCVGVKDQLTHGLGCVSQCLGRNFLAGRFT